jgi:hypothetical protein
MGLRETFSFFLLFFKKVPEKKRITSQSFKQKSKLEELPWLVSLAKLEDQ